MSRNCTLRPLKPCLGHQLELEIRELDASRFGDLEALFGTNDSANRCWCTWFVIAVKEYHANGSFGNRERFCSMMATSKVPMGLLAYLKGEPVGWCAVGPRSRFARATKTPTLKGVDHAEDDTVWFVPCFFVRSDCRGHGVSTALLQGAVGLAENHQATAIEGFPLTAGRRHTSDTQVGLETVFRACGFRLVRQPSPGRVVMRLDLKSQ